MLSMSTLLCNQSPKHFHQLKLFIHRVGSSHFSPQSLSNHYSTFSSGGFDHSRYLITASQVGQWQRIHLPMQEMQETWF